MKKLACALLLVAAPCFAAEVVVGKKTGDIKRVRDALSQQAYLTQHGIDLNDPALHPGVVAEIRRSLEPLDHSQHGGTDPLSGNILSAISALESPNTLRWTDTRAWAECGDFDACSTTAAMVAQFLGLEIRGVASQKNACLVKFKPKLVLRVDCSE